MRLAQTYHTDLNKTRWKKKARDQFYGKSRVRREYYGGDLIYNNALYEIELPDEIEIEAPGGQDALNIIHSWIDCRKTDIDGTVTNGLEYRIEPQDLTIPPNTSEDPKYGTFTVIQEKTGLSLEGVYKQNGAELTGVSYKNLQITNIYYKYSGDEEYIAASGGSAELVVEYSADKVLHYTSQIDQDGGKVYGDTTVATVLTGGKYNYDHVSFNSNGKVTADSLYDSNQPYTFAIAYISKLSITVTFVPEEFPNSPTTLSASWTSSSANNNIICYQQYNKQEKRTVVKSVFEASEDELEADAAATTVYTTITSYDVVTYTYTSNYTTPEKDEAVGGRVSESSLTVTPNPWTTKKQELNISVPANTTGNEVTYKVVITNGSKNITITVKQTDDYITGYTNKNKRSDSLSSDTIPAAGGSANAVQIWVNVKYDIYAIWASGRQTFFDDSETSVKATSISGSTVSDTGGAKTGTKVYANSRGIVEDDYDRHVYTVTSASCTFDGSVVSFSGSHKVLQQYNIPESEYDGNYVLSVSCNDEPIGPAGGSRTATINSYRYHYVVYTSSAEKESKKSINTSITKSSTSVTLSTTTVSGSGDTCKITFPGNNYNTSDKEYWVKFTQSGSADYETFYFTVEADSTERTYGSYTQSGDAYANEIGPEGGTVQVYFDVSRSYSDKWVSDGTVAKSGSETVTVTATSVSSDISTNIGTASGGKVSAGSRGTEEDENSRKVYKISSASGKIGTTTVSGSYSTAYVWQQGNSWSDSAAVYTLSRTPDSDHFDARGGTTTVTVDSYSRIVRTYDSGSTKDIDSSVSASIVSGTTAVATVSPAQVTGKSQTFTITVSKNQHTTTTRSSLITITQSGSNKKLTVQITQDADYLIEECTGYIAQSVGAEEIPASGGSTQVQVTYSTTCYKYSYATGQQVGTGTTTSKTVDATSLTTPTSGNIGTVSGGKVSAGSREQVTGDRRIVYTIGGGTTSLGQFALTGYVYQEANEYIGETTTDSLSISKTSPSGNVANTGGTASFAVSATYSGTADYTSGSYNISGNRTATISVTPTGYKSISPTSITGTNNTILTLNPNYTGAITYTVKATMGSTNKTATVTQNAVSLVITPEQKSLLADSEAVTVYVVYTSTINGSANPANVSSNVSWATVGNTTVSGTKYTTAITLTKNTSTTNSRIATITIATSSGTVKASATVTITQDPSTVQKETRVAKFNGTFTFRPTLSGFDPTVINIGPTESGYSKATFSAIEDSDYVYSGGTFSYYFIVSSTKSASGKITQTTTSTITVTKGSQTQISELTITGSTSAANYVLVYINGSLSETYMIEQPAPL